MSFAKVHSAHTNFLSPRIVDIEVDIAKGLHSFAIVGLPDKAVEESRDRMSAAIKNSGFKSPRSKNEKVVVSLAPADVKKEGPLFDLPIALSYLLASSDIRFDPARSLFVGELSLNGEIRSVPGALPLARCAREAGFSEIFVPKDNAAEAALIAEIAVYGVSTLAELLKHLSGTAKLVPQPHTAIPEGDAALSDFRDIKGQEAAKRGLEIAAAGGHNIALSGPAGTGKTLLARAFASILPPLSYEEILEVTAIHSVAGALKTALVVDPPFRAPHHTSSYVSLVGGGANPRPGEITLAHRGVLFLDEFPEFDRRVLEALRQPLEEGFVTVARSKGTARFPANVTLVAAMNPCPCGNYGTEKTCSCSASDVGRYRRKLSGPIADRIDLWLSVPLVPHRMLSDETMQGEGSSSVRARVAAARGKALTRLSGTGISRNADMSAKDIERLVPLAKETKDLLNASAEKLKLSPRAYHKVIKLARTIADLAGKEAVETADILEALQYRPRE